MIENYIDYLRNVAGYSMNTCQAYENDLRNFAVWAMTHTAEGRWSAISQMDIENYIKYLTLHGYQSNSTNRALSAIRGIYRYWQRNGMVPSNPAKNVLPRLVPTTIPTTISTDNLMKVYTAADAETKLIISLLYTTGIRVQELLDIRWQDVDLDNGSILINGKGSKQRYVYIGKGICEVMRERRSQEKGKGVIFYLSQRTIRHKLHEAAMMAGVEQPISPHVIRHTIATEWAANGANAQTLAKALGHAKIETSAKYVNMAHLDTRDVMMQNNMFN